MKGLTSRDGKMTGNVQMVGSYDKSKQPRETEHGGESGGVREPSGHDEIKHVNGEHGSAHTVITKKGPAGGAHSTSHHEDGHVHEQEHDNIEDAGEHMKAAMDGEHDEMEGESEDRAGERDEMEHSPKSKTPDFMS
jgi:hypothetical protein